MLVGFSVDRYLAVCHPLKVSVTGPKITSIRNKIADKLAQHTDGVHLCHGLLHTVLCDACAHRLLRFGEGTFHSQEKFNFIGSALIAERHAIFQDIIMGQEFDESKQILQRWHVLK